VRSASRERPEPTISFAEALRFWLKVGFISFGGPAGQIAILHQELVERRRWISEQRFLHALNYCMLLPGPEAQQLATYIGWLMHRTRGGLVAGSLFFLPSLFILIALSWVYVAYGHTPLVASIFFGIKPAIVAIVAFAAYRIGKRVIHSALLLAIAASAFLAISLLHIAFPWIVLTAGALGFVLGRVAPNQLKETAAHGATRKAYGPALIDDDSPAPAHANFRWSRMLTVAMIGLASWAGVLCLLYGLQGTNDVLSQMGVFFTKAALLTFGGAYAVLPYVYQGAVDQFGWVTPLQMIDGLALGETTPGPLIMVVAFVGFVGAWEAAGALSLSPTMAGVLGAVVATYFTFLPSFLFIFLGAPLIEATRKDLRFTAPLTAITAAVVGVILNLAVFLADHIFWPKGFPEDVQWHSAAIAIVAGLALWRFKVGVIPVVLGSSVVGILIRAALNF
jgi:chromate transporter